MKTENPLQESPPRRKFLAGLVASVTASAAFLLTPKRARSDIQKAPTPRGGPILYHRTEETERYYRTLYR